MEVRIEAENLVQVVAKFQAMGGSIRNNSNIKQALRAASKYMNNKAKNGLQNVLKGKSQYLIDSPTYTINKGNSGSLVGFKKLVYISQSGNSSRLSGASWWIDRGTALRKTSKGYNRGRITATGFWQDAIDTGSGIALNMIQAAVEENILKIINRAI